MYVHVANQNIPMYTQLVPYPHHSFYYGPTYIPPTYYQHPSIKMIPYISSPFEVR